MKKILFGLSCVLFGGCISPNATVMDTTGDTDNVADGFDSGGIDTEDSESEIDTSDTDTDDGPDGETQDTDPIALTDDGLEFMRDQYLLFDGTMYLQLDLVSQGTGRIDLQQPLANFLRMSSNWAFGVSFGAFDADSWSQMTGSGLSLFSGGGIHIVLTLHEDGEGHRAIFEVYRFDNTGGNLEVCSVYTVSSSAADKVSQEVLKNGFHIVVQHTRTSNSESSFKIYLHTTDGFALNFQSTNNGSGSCNMDFVPTDTFQFGAGSTVSGVQELAVSPLRSRVDDIILINETGVDAIVAENDPIVESDRIRSLYTFEDPQMDLDSSVIDDGWHWFPIDPSEAKLDSADFESLIDETVEQNGVSYTLYMLPSDSTRAEITSQGALEYYFRENTSWNP